MEALFLYLLKSGSVLALFLVTYLLFLKKETFFIGNRVFLVVGLLSALIVPFITFTKTILVTPQPFNQGTFQDAASTFTLTETVQSFNWLGLMATLYVLGILFFSIRLVVQLWALRKIKNDSDVFKQGKLTHIKTEKEISPFSFFKYIFYNPQLFNPRDLHIILKHEKVHATQMHSLDILLSEMVLIIQWFNPILWLYKKSIKENLEYLADAYTCVDQTGKKHYQYLLLQKVTGTNKVPIANPFFNSLIKKRIVMLNQNQSKKVNLLKLFIVLPFVMAFLLAFNVREEVKFPETFHLSPLTELSAIDFQSPLEHSDIRRISARFGLGQNTLEKNTFHNGIDLVAPTGTKVLASNSGTVEVSSETASNGNYIIIEHESGYSTKYMHLKDRSVQEGEKVALGATIGHVGNTGKSTGPHLHFEILKSDKPVNPESLVAFKIASKTVKKARIMNDEPQASSNVKVELMIDKNTTDDSLLKMKNDLVKDGIDFSYTTVRNEEKEIIDISIQVSGKSKNGSSFNNSYNSSDKGKAISPLMILIDLDNNLVSIGSKGAHKSNTFKVHTGGSSVWVNSDDDKEIHIKKVNGKKVIVVNGEEIEEEELQELQELEEMDVHVEEDAHVFISKEADNSNVFIHSDSDDDHDIRVIGKKGNGFFFIDNDGKKPLYIVDGKESSAKKVKKLDSDDIKTIDVSKGEKAVEKYGKKAKNGVVDITTKKN